MKGGGGERERARASSVRTPRAGASKAAGTAAPTVEAVAARLLALFPPGESPALWKETDLKRRLSAKELPRLAGALARLQEQRQVLTLSQGKSVFYLFAGPLRGWLNHAPVAQGAEPTPTGTGVDPAPLLAAYTGLVRQSGGFPDVKIATLRAALDPVAADELPARLVGLWREGRATLSQGDWSLADEATRAAAVLLHSERYLLVRLEDERA